MESTQSIKRRIRAVTNTEQITKAMEMVSANKMRRSQEIALASRPYSITALELLRELSGRTAYVPPLMEQRKIEKTLILIVTADKGLAGSLNSNVFRKFEKEFPGVLAGLREDYVFAAVGKKAEDYLSRKHLPAINGFTGFGDFVDTNETDPLANFLINGYEAKEFDKVIVLSTHFRSTLRQDVLVRELLPVTLESIGKTIEELVPEYGRYAEERLKNGEEPLPKYFEYLIEPSPQEIMPELTHHLLRMTAYHIVLEANASEHSARMVAMKNASDNAGELKDDLSLLYNKSRQASITREISEITAGAESLKSGN